MVRSGATSSDGAEVVHSGATSSDGALVLRCGATCSDAATRLRESNNDDNGSMSVDS